MIYTLKTSIVIAVLSVMAIALLTIFVRRNLRTVAQTAMYANASAFLVLCITQIYAAFGAVAAVTALFARKRSTAAGTALFLIIVLPQIGITVMVGSLQLFNISSTACVGLGLLVGSLFWTGRNGSAAFISDIPACAIILVFTFIGARDSTFTNLLRVVTENLITFVIPYMLVRKALGDPACVRNAFLLVIGAGLALSAIAIFESVRVWPMYQVYGQQFGTLVNAGVKMRGGMLRAGGPMMNPPLSGTILTLCVVTAFAARDLFPSRMGFRIVMAVLIVGLFCMQARGAWLGAVCGSIGVVFSRRGGRAIAGYLPTMLLAGVVVYGAALTSPRVASLVGFSSDARSSNEYRDRLSDLGFETVRAHPLIGQPIEAVKQQMVSMTQGEGIIDFVNGYLAIALFSGLIGLSLFVGALLLQGINAYTARRTVRQRGAGSLADLGLGIVFAAASMFPFVPTEPRIVSTILLLFALSNSVSHAFKSETVKPARALLARRLDTPVEERSALA
ncbi:hypothetical protein Q5H91_12515 [Sphingomonas sp. KR1UV-12]|uniref:O-antigen ligase-related domain-containing protein n=1 Tax=Sphingomonas aurea TaxID=3063994 RepID=A0ABT9EM64_9SPHN|nr:O-antigen ligase family protein [Sphingomonas sp. KR1UV-12]MDP1028039.1 hypothetical protein [Sphingomonas sp. KR1UV-12]